VTSWRNEHGTVTLTGPQLAELIALVADGTLSTKLARQVLTDVLEGHGDPGEIAERRGFRQISDEAELTRIVDQVLIDHADAAQRVRAGNPKAIGALVGAVMRATKGKANPALVNRLLSDRLSSS
jgi:Asp-tRNA(Asn)/Glu-tRNA(Gln) amidotransferase B subunit